MLIFVLFGTNGCYWHLIIFVHNLDNPDIVLFGRYSEEDRLKIHKSGLLCVGGSEKLYSVQFSFFRWKLILDGNGSEWIEQGDAFDRIMDRDIDAAEGILTFIMISLSLDLSSSRIYHLFEHHQNDPKTFWISSLLVLSAKQKLF